MKKRDLGDGLVGPRLEETLDQIFCMNGMTTAEKVDFLMSRNRELRAENERLREQGARLFDKTLELGTENAKLRELARAAWRCIHTGASCSDCRLIAGGCTLQTAMRELGVEL